MGPTEDLALGHVLRCSIDEPSPIAHRLTGDENALRIPTVDDVAKAHALFADEVLRRYFQIVMKSYWSRD